MTFSTYSAEGPVNLSEIEMLYFVLLGDGVLSHAVYCAILGLVSAYALASPVRASNYIKSFVLIQQLMPWEPGSIGC